MVSGLLLSCCHVFSRAIRFSLCKSILLIVWCRDLRISCNSWFYFIFDVICMPLDMICISKRAINFHPSISIKANGITSHYRGQPRTVTSSYKYAASKKDEKANPFWSNNNNNNRWYVIILFNFKKYVHNLQKYLEYELSTI